jgi:hypothetical protein
MRSNAVYFPWMKVPTLALMMACPSRRTIRRQRRADLRPTGARTHARVGDAALMAGYCGKSAVLDNALAEWAESYGDQTEQDHTTLVESIK